MTPDQKIALANQQDALAILHSTVSTATIGYAVSTIDPEASRRLFQSLLHTDPAFSGIKIHRSRINPDREIWIVK